MRVVIDMYAVDKKPMGVRIPPDVKVGGVQCDWAQVTTEFHSDALQAWLDGRAPLLLPRIQR